MPLRKTRVQLIDATFVKSKSSARKSRAAAHVAHLQKLQMLAWYFFLAASALMLVVAPLEIGDAQIRAAIREPGLQNALLGIFHALDAVWLTLAAVNTYLFTAQREGIATARRWALIILLVSGALGWCDAASGFPFGARHFTDRAGARIAGVLPFAWPLLLFSVVLNSRYTVLRIFPRAGQLSLALATAVFSLLTDLSLEPFAWKMRTWWLWHPPAFSASRFPQQMPPIANFAAWFALSFALAFFLREERVTPLSERFEKWKPMFILLAMNIVFLAANCARWLRR